MSIARSVTLVLALALPLTSSRADGMQESAPAPHDGHAATVSSALVEQVREATAPFRDVSNVPAGYGPVLGCVSGPLTGAMGVHFINLSLVGDATLDPAPPEALIYESRNGATRLVGVEFIVLFDVWHETHMLRPGDDGYEERRRVHNALIDKRPAAIASCRGVADIVDAVGLARAAGLEASVRGGGHTDRESILSSAA